MPQDLTPASWFATFRVREGLLLFQEKHYWAWNRSNVWLLKGRERDLLVDAGLGVAGLRAHLAPFLDKPLTAVATHVHFDHAGGLYEFDEAGIHEAEAAALSAGDPVLTLCAPELGWVNPAHFEKPPFEGFDASRYSVRPKAPSFVLRDGDVLDLGGPALEVLHLPGHSPGCVALRDAASGELFSGDVAYDGELLDQLPGSCVGDYLKSCERLAGLPVTTVYPGHYGIFGGGELATILRKYISTRAKTRPGG